MPARNLCFIIITMNQLKVTCPNETSTMKVAEKLAGQLASGELVELAGDVGSGKTTFVKGLAKGLDSNDRVSSPSFALKNIYHGRLKLYHFDLYRLNEAGLMDHEIKDSLDDKDAVSVIEWAGVSSNVLPKTRITVNFEIIGENSRQLTITMPDFKEPEK